MRQTLNRLRLLSMLAEKPFLDIVAPFFTKKEILNKKLACARLR